MNLLKKLYKVKSRLAIGAALMGLILFSGCREDVIDEPGINFTPGGSQYYFSIDLNVPENATTRSFTTSEGNAGHTSDSDNDILNGTSTESLVEKADLFFCDTDYNVLLKLSAIKHASNGSKYTMRAQVEDINDLTKIKGQDLQLVVVCNPTDVSSNFAKDNQGGKDGTFSFTDVTASPLGDFGKDGNSMPMTNVSEYPIEVFKNITTDDTNELLAQLRALFLPSEDVLVCKLGDALSVERAVARLDLKDRTSGNNWTYTVGEGTSNAGQLKIKMYSVQPFNVNKSSYVLRHRSNGTNEKADAEIGLFGNEKGDTPNIYTWVAGSDWSSTLPYTKTTNFLNKLDPEDKYLIKNNGSASNAGELTISYITTTDYNLKRNPQDGYYPCFYVSENTLPNINLMNEDNLPNNATGVAFKFEILDKNNSSMTIYTPTESYPAEVAICIDEDEEEESTEDPGTQVDLEDEGDTEPGEVVTRKIKITMNDGKWMDVEAAADGKFYLTYYGFIRHNDVTITSTETNVTDSGTETVEVIKPGPMRYAVVRNNVYQMHIKNIENLPFPEEPKNLYLALEIRVLAWARHDISVVF